MFLIHLNMQILGAKFDDYYFEAGKPLDLCFVQSPTAPTRGAYLYRSQKRSRIILKIQKNCINKLTIPENPLYYKQSVRLMHFHASIYGFFLARVPRSVGWLEHS